MATDIYKTITRDIIRALENGVAPWIQPWQNLGGLARNADTGREYTGTNALLLAIQQSTKSYATPYWVTFAQARRLGGFVNKGEHGTQLILVKPTTYSEVDENTGETTETTRRIVSHFTVFNIDQCALDRGAILAKHATPFAMTAEFERHAAAEDLINCAQIKHAGDRPSYDRQADAITLPTRESFENVAAYYATALHELAHWTGHPSRLDRDQAGGFGTARYAFEELTAELGSAFLCARFGIQGKLQHAEYIGHWIQLLRDDKHALTRAASAAMRTVRLLLSEDEPPHSRAPPLETLYQ